MPPAVATAMAVGRFSLVIDLGERLHRLRDWLGHSSVLMTSRYLHVMA